MIHARADYNRIQDPINKIKEDEPVFLLRAKDKFMPETVRDWARKVLSEGGDSRLAAMAFDHAKLAEEWQQKNGCKLPDLPKEKRKFNLNSFYRFTNLDNESVIVYYYFNPNTKCEGFGFNISDGGGFLPVNDLSDNSIVEPIEFWIKSVEDDHVNLEVFRELTVKEEAEFRKWARDNFNPHNEIVNSVWHPIVRDECYKMIKEVENNSKD